jgi:hypothetical protein
MLRRARSQIQKSISIFCFGQKAAIAFTEDTVAIVGNYVVSPIAKPPGDDSQQRRSERPRSAYLLQNRNDRVRARRKPFLGPAAFFDEVHGIQIAGIEAVTSQDFGCEVALQRCIMEAPVRISLQAELHQTVAESANSVVENDRVREIGSPGPKARLVCRT